MRDGGQRSPLYPRLLCQNSHSEAIDFRFDFHYSCFEHPHHACAIMPTSALLLSDSPRHLACRTCGRPLRSAGARRMHVEGPLLVIGDDEIPLRGLRRIVVVGAGKAGAGMAAAVEEVLGPQLAEDKKLTGWLRVMKILPLTSSASDRPSPGPILVRRLPARPWPPARRGDTCPRRPCSRRESRGDDWDCASRCRSAAPDR